MLRALDKPTRTARIQIIEEQKVIEMITEYHSKLAKRFSAEVVGSMDMDTLIDYARDCLFREYTEQYTIEQLVTEVEEYFPKLLEGVFFVDQSGQQ